MSATRQPVDFFSYDYMTSREATGWPPPGTPIIRYRRASSENQYAKGHGLEDQRVELQRVETTRGYTCAADVEEVYSGTFTHRPGLERVYALLRSAPLSHAEPGTHEPGRATDRRHADP
jgi:hypothetical protein